MTYTASEAQRHARLLQSDDFQGTSYESAACFFRSAKTLLPEVCNVTLARDIDLIEFCLVNSSSISASTLNFTDGSSLVMIHKGLVDWIRFYSQICSLAEETISGIDGWKHGYISNLRSAKITIRAVLRSRLIMARMLDSEASPCLEFDEASGFRIRQREARICMYAMTFIIAHEIAHAALDHGTSEKFLFPWQERVPLVSTAHDLEFEADEFAAAATHGIVDIRDRLDVYDEKEYRLGILGALASMGMWEEALFLRRAKTHPEASERYRRVLKYVSRTHLSGRTWRTRRRISKETRKSVLSEFLIGGIPAPPVPSRYWLTAASHPSLSPLDRHNLMITSIYDRIVTGRGSPDWEALSREYNLGNAFLDIGQRLVDGKAFFRELGLAPDHVDHLCDKERPLSYRAAVSYLVQSEAMSSIPIEDRERSVLAYAILVAAAQHVMADPWEW